MNSFAGHMEAAGFKFESVVGNMLLVSQVCILAENFTRFCIICKLKSVGCTTFVNYTNTVKRHRCVLNFGLNLKFVQLGCEEMCSEIWKLNAVISYPIYGEGEKMLKERNLLMKNTVINNKFAVCLDALI